MELDTGTVLLAAAAALILFNLIVSRALILDGGATPLQKIFQMILIWLLPLFGGVLILYLIASHHDREEMTSLAPWPFYMAAVPCRSEDASNHSSSSHDIAEGTCGEGSCGGD